MSNQVNKDSVVSSLPQALQDANIRVSESWDDCCLMCIHGFKQTIVTGRFCDKHRQYVRHLEICDDYEKHQNMINFDDATSYKIIDGEIEAGDLFLLKNKAVHKCYKVDSNGIWFSLNGRTGYKATTKHCQLVRRS